MIRANYSNPPAHGASVDVSTLEQRCAAGNLGSRNDRYARAHPAYASAVQYPAGERREPRLQPSASRTACSFSGLTKEQLFAREEFAIYAVASGRINVAGMTPVNMAPLCEAFCRLRTVSDSIRYKKRPRMRPFYVRVMSVTRPASHPAETGYYGVPHPASTADHGRE